MGGRLQPGVCNGNIKDQGFTGQEMIDIHLNDLIGDLCHPGRHRTAVGVLELQFKPFR